MNIELKNDGLWCCHFEDGEIVVCSLAATQKGSQSACIKKLGIDSWKSAKDKGIRCIEVQITPKINNSSDM